MSLVCVCVCMCIYVAHAWFSISTIFTHPQFSVCFFFLFSLFYSIIHIHIVICGVGRDCLTIFIYVQYKKKNESPCVCVYMCAIKQRTHFSYIYFSNYIYYYMVFPSISIIMNISSFFYYIFPFLLFATVTVLGNFQLLFHFCYDNRDSFLYIHHPKKKVK